MANRTLQLPLDMEPDVSLEPIPAGVEGEDDLQQVRPNQVRETVVAASDWTTETILRQLDRGNININPEFQRRDAWNASRKSKFIESLILGLPIPQLVLAENKKQKNSFIVIDGKQRLLSLRQFAAKHDDPTYDQLKLTGLEQRSDLNGLTYDDLQNDQQLSNDLTSFDNQTIRTVVIKNWPNEDILYLIFLRLNTGSVPLSPQELRQALHPGPFLSFVDRKSGELKGFKVILKSNKPDFRMRDAELLVRYYAFKNYLPEYSGNLKLFLDETCEKLNGDWIAQQQMITDQLTELDHAFSATFEIFSEANAFRKWENGDYERRFNRAIFDVMTYYFSDKRIRAKALSDRVGVEKEFRKVCETRTEFLRSVETTTKSIDATATRFEVWGTQLARRLKLKISVPHLVDGRMKVG